MAGMKRFVTYIYAYEEKQKAGNTGFAKIEIRGEDCRLEIHLRGAYLSHMNCKVYLFHQEAGEIEGVLLGQMNVNNGAGDFATMLKVGKLGNTPFTFADMEGIFLCSDDQRIFMSRWKEGAPLAVSMTHFREWEPKTQMQTPHEPEKQMNARKDRQPHIMAAQKQQPRKNVQPESTDNAETNQPSNFIREAERDLNRDKRQEESQQQLQKNVKLQPEKAMEQPEKLAQQPEKEARQQTRETDLPKGRREQEQSIHEAEEDMAATEIPMRNIFPRYNWMEIWKNLIANHLTATPFEDKQIICVKIELKDLKELPRRYWYLGNNSFLLHGFFNYHYLVIGKIADDRWFIGVPGIYQSQERVMAAIFGFPEFLPEPVENQFGYWYRFIEE